MHREIPGFYYDTTKRKYFRIEDARTAPSGAAWSAPNVKRRAVEAKEDKARRERRRREKGRVRRARVLSLREGPLVGGLLGREAVGGLVTGGEVVARAWAAGLKAKGSLSWLAPREGVVSAMWIRGSDVRSEMGLAYAVVNGAGPVAAYLPRDADDCINFQDAAVRYPHSDFRFRNVRGQNERNYRAIKFHEPSSRIFMAWESSSVIGITHFTPRSRDPSESGQTWVVGSDVDAVLTTESILTKASATAFNALQPAPPASRLTCIAGTSAGVAQLQNNNLTWLTPSPPPSQRHPKHTPKSNPAAPWQGDVLSVDFLGQNPTEVILAGTRSGHVCVLDTRVPPHEWSVPSNSFQHVSSAAHVRAVGEYGVLAAGPPNAMALYDVRYLRQRNPPFTPTANLGNNNAARPIVTFPHYDNAANIHAGLDVLTAAGYGGGIVATAHTSDVSTPSSRAAAAAPPTLTLQQQQQQQRNGFTANTNTTTASRRRITRGSRPRGEEEHQPQYGVALHSLRDGTRIAGGEVDGIRAPAVVQSLMWQTLPGDRHPSLFVGEGPNVGKYSFWA
ncbi:hypothetical protein F5144DRAFT_656663 [Chaetomium tenue]|uniref:Uncharacterized protein n=1 Tax=Chaetomium tenue TaxID=1854479 RepID=A0ACB7NZ46_9PEZI|nr:hypothetical protein F5144DRAFT_656663 [Chaetomium globosum]